jgi:hypothetical protein
MQDSEENAWFRFDLASLCVSESISESISDAEAEEGQVDGSDGRVLIFGQALGQHELPGSKI